MRWLHNCFLQNSGLCDLAFHYDFSPGGSLYRGPWRQLLPSPQAQEMSLGPWGIGLGDSFCPTLPIQPQRGCSISLTPLPLRAFVSRILVQQLFQVPVGALPGSLSLYTRRCAILSSRGKLGGDTWSAQCCVFSLPFTTILGLGLP